MLTALLAVAVTVVGVLAVVAAPLVALRARWRGPVRPLSTVSALGLGAASAVLQEPLGLAIGLALGGWLQWDGRRRRRRRALRAAARRAARTERLTGAWAAPVTHATAAARSYQACVTSLDEGPLRDRLVGLAPEVDRAVAQVRHTALTGQRAERAAAEMAAAGRRTVRGAAADPALSEAAAGRRAGAARLNAIAAEQRRRLVLAGARLDALVADAVEVAALARTSAWWGSPDPTADPWPGEDVAALRAALADRLGAGSDRYVRSCTQ